MNTRPTFIMAATLATLLVLLGAGARPAIQAQEAGPQEAAGGGANAGTGFTYQGRLHLNGAPVNGNCDIAFQLFDALAGGSPTTTALTQTVTVSGGLFATLLDFGGFYGPFDGDAKWLQMRVRCPAASGAFQLLTPRQQLTGAPYALGLRLPLSLHTDSGGALLALHNTRTSSVADGLSARTDSSIGTGVLGYASSSSGSTIGVKGQSNGATGTGVSGVALHNSGANYGVWGESLSTSGIGVRASASNGGVAINAFSNGSGINQPTVEIQNGNASGISIFAQQNSSDAVLVVTNEGSGDLIRGFGSSGGSEFRFQVTQTGTVRADCCYLTPVPGDFAEMWPATAGLEPGDVLVIGLDGQLALSSEAYQASVVGVYSTQPSYLANSQFAGAAGYVPLAITGIVPVKASAENGPIRPGDLLAAAATPGHVMRCEGAEQCFGRTLGKALEGLEAETGVIQMLAMLH